MFPALQKLSHMRKINTQNRFLSDRMTCEMEGGVCKELEMATWSRSI